ncbi:MAG: hypothetical protein IT427_20025 [Pirellulales bacterium]|nr:hypothetical protein [Pirellulales bacterium]
MRWRSGGIVSLVATVWCSMAGSSTNAAVLWTENAENGYGNVIDGTDTSYPLIQTDVVGQGANAFHLANPDFQDNWFEIDQTLTIQADSKLFFSSRLGYATPTQVAKVQISTDGGSTWPTTIYDQQGTDDAGEGRFGLQEIGLASYANQNLRFRFNYDYMGGSAYPQSDPGVGWYIDDIQIADQFQKSQYSIGDPSAEEQQYLEYINRARTDALVEADRLATETDTDILASYSYFGIQPQNIINQFTVSVNNGFLDQNAQPLSFNEKLNTMAKLHSQDMFENQFQGHDNSANPPAPLTPNGTFSDRLTTVGYIGNAGENVYAHSVSVAEGHAAFDVDWGDISDPNDPDCNSDFNGQGMQNPADHRRNIHHDDFKEIGVGVVLGTNGPVGPQLVTEVFGNPGNVSLITGVVYEDLNGNNFYDIGEGRSGVRIDVEDSAYFAISSTSGGYSVPVMGDGTYVVMFSGGGFPTINTTATIFSGENFKLDYLAAPFVQPADFDGDGDVDGADFVVWQTNFPTVGGATLSQGDADGDGDVDGADFVMWQTNFPTTPGIEAAAVPEPSGWMLSLIALGAVLFRPMNAGSRPQGAILRSLLSRFGRSEGFCRRRKDRPLSCQLVCARCTQT